MKKIDGVPFYRQSFGRAEIVEVTDTIKSGWVTTGKKAMLLENKIAEYVNVKHAAAVNSCTAAMHLLLTASGISKGDEVVTTPYTFAATSEVILYTGAKPVYCDINYDSLNIDAETAAKKISKKTRAILPVHIAGLPVHMDGFVKLAKISKAKLFDDAAHAIGAEYKGKKIGSIGDGSAFSFYATKNLTTGEGGMVTTKNAKLAKKIKMLSLHAMSKGAWKRYAKGGTWRYDLLDLGYKYNLSDLAASLGLAQFEKFERFQKLRERACLRYIKNLSDTPDIKTPLIESESKHAWHLFMIRLQLNQLKINRNEFIHELNQKNIGTSVHFIPLFLQSFYRTHLKLNRKDFPNADKAFKEVITLPLFPDIKNNEIDYVCDVISAICKKYRR
ncbi:MAG: DegT/DnrJ/EryC1/StrS aminotransferase family protein [candidate division Zixibacteria bacterium]|nr:DegT/DnrJ/EryC1/StrS aminotransferase family protein [candidate division Zixibacteria bacterium]